MKIVFFIGSLSGGGAERVVCNLANFLDKKGHQVSILTMSEVKRSYRLNSGVQVVSLLSMTGRKGFLYNNVVRGIRMIRFLYNVDVDIYIVMLPITTIILLSMKWLTKAKVIAAERAIPSIYSRNKQRLLKLLANKADGWVFQTCEEQLWYGSYIGSTKYKVIPNAINSEFIREPYIGKRANEIVTVGRLASQKNQKMLITAFSFIHKEFPDYKVVIYGEGKEKDSLKKLIDKLSLTGKVYLSGFKDGIAEKIKKASLFVLSSDYEGMPNALMEAMALGLPCISTDCDGGGARFLIEDGVNGLLVPKSDVNALAVAMKRLLSQKTFAEKCGKNAHEICKILAPEKIYGMWETFVKELVGNR